MPLHVMEQSSMAETWTAIEDIHQGDRVLFFGGYYTVLSIVNRMMRYDRGDGTTGELKAEAGDQFLVWKPVE